MDTVCRILVSPSSPPSSRQRVVSDRSISAKAKVTSRKWTSFRRPATIATMPPATVLTAMANPRINQKFVYSHRVIAMPVA